MEKSVFSSKCRDSRGRSKFLERPDVRRTSQRVPSLRWRQCPSHKRFPDRTETHFFTALMFSLNWEIVIYKTRLMRKKQK